MKYAVIVGVIGKWRKMLKNVLESKGTNVVCFIDNITTEKEYQGIPIIKDYEIEENLRDFAGEVYFTFPAEDERRKNYVQKVLSKFKNTVTVYSYFETYTINREALFLARKAGDSWLSEEFDEKRANEVMNLFNDEKSRNIMQKWIEFRKELDLLLIPYPEENQYIPDDVPVIDSIPTTYNFMDLGAYDGDTLLFVFNRLRNFGKELGCYIALEPEGKNYSMLKERIEKLKETTMKSQKFLLLKTACSDKYTVFSIFAEGQRSKLIDEQDDFEELERAYSVVLDDIIHNIRIDFVKMDVEGFELPCLHGLKRIINESRPVLAVSIYHKPEDFYTIPEFLNEHCTDYDFYVRVHSTFFIDTVLYAVPRGR